MHCTFSKLLFCIFAVSLTVDAHELEQLRGLKRFDKVDDLGSSSVLEIKNVYIGDNALAESIALFNKGGKIHTVTGGTRSEKVQFSFFQPYKNSRLEQILELKFNKDNGFVNQLSSTYKISSAYLDISPIREKVLQAAIDKYGSPLTIEEVRDISDQQQGEVDLRRFINKLTPNDAVKEQVLEYFSRRNISKDAKFTANNRGHALMHTGFDQCFVWQQNNFTEILSFCAFGPNAANASSRGVELSLHNFVVAQQIADRKSTVQQQESLSISL
jgi:hypothetical protein